MTQLVRDPTDGHEYDADAAGRELREAVHGFRRWRDVEAMRAAMARYRAQHVCERDGESHEGDE